MSINSIHVAPSSDGHFTEVRIKGDNDGLGTLTSDQFSVKPFKSCTAAFSMTGDAATATITRKFWNDELFDVGDLDYMNFASAADGSGNLYEITEADEDIATPPSVKPGGLHRVSVGSNNGTSAGDWTLVLTLEH